MNFVNVATTASSAALFLQYKRGGRVRVGVPERMRACVSLCAINTNSNHGCWRQGDSNEIVDARGGQISLRAVVGSDFEKLAQWSPAF